MDLTQLKAGEKAVFKGVQGGRGIRSRLEAMGITPEAVIMKISAQLMRGPVIIKAGETELAIGFGMAKRIIVERIKE